MYLNVGKLLHSHKMGGKLAPNDQINLMFMFCCKKCYPRGSSVTAPGLYTGLGPLFSNIIYSETTLEAKLYVDPPLERETKHNINGYMTKMAVMPIYGRFLLNSSSEQSQMILKLNIGTLNIGDSSSTKFIDMITLG